MDVKDVAFIASPLSSGIRTLEPDEPRLTLQHFKTVSNVIKHVAPHNCDARRSDSNEWPRSLIFDVAYGYAALNTWGTPRFTNFTRMCTRNSYYDNLDNGDNENGDGGSGEGGNGGGGGGSDHRNIGGHGESSQQNPCAERAANRQKRRLGRQLESSNPADPQAPDLADMLLALWMHNARKRQRRAHEKKVERTQEKVRAWLDSAE